MCGDYNLGFASPASRRHPWAPTCASSSPTLEGAAGRSTRSVLAHERNLIEDMERLDLVPACSRWQANQLPAHRYLLGCCARHRSVRAGWSHLRDDQAHVGEDRRPRRANDRCGARRGKPSLQPQNAFRLSPRGSARRARPTTMAGGRGGGLCRTGGSPRFPGATGRTHDDPRHHRWSLGVVPFLSLDRLQKLHSRHYIIPPMPPWLWSGWPASFFAASATPASVVIIRPAMEAASCKAMRTTLAGSMMPISNMSPYSPA
jgi:hypothetical protein